MSAETIIGTCSPWICICLFFINVLEYICAEILIHNALCLPSIIKNSKYRNSSGNCWIVGGSNSQILVKIKFYRIYEFMIYCIHKCSKELFKAFYWFSRFLPLIKFVRIISSLHILTKIGGLWWNFEYVIYIKTIRHCWFIFDRIMALDWNQNLNRHGCSQALG